MVPCSHDHLLPDEHDMDLVCAHFFNLSSGLSMDDFGSLSQDDTVPHVDVSFDGNGDDLLNSSTTPQASLLHTHPQHCLNDLQPPSGCVFSMYPLLSANTSYHITSCRVLRLVLTRNGFCSGHAMLIVILDTLPQNFPCQLMLL